MVICYRFRPLRSLPLLFAFCATLGCTGCVHKEPRADIVIINGAEPESLDPAIVTGQPEMRIALALFEGLTRFDPRTGQAVPGLAESWERSTNGRTYTFHLRSNAVWSTGEPITADDVVYSWQRLLDPKTAALYAGQLYYLKNAASGDEAGTKSLNCLLLRLPPDRTSLPKRLACVRRGPRP